MPNLPNIKAYDGQGKYIFVSYSHKEKEAVYPFIAALQEKYNVWFDEGIHYGHEWEDEIAEKLDGCSIFIYMISNTSLESDNCKDELHLARSQKKNFMNVNLFEDTVFPKWFELRYLRYQICNYFNFSSPESAVEDLSRKCKWFEEVKRETVDRDEEKEERNFEITAPLSDDRLIELFNTKELSPGKYAILGVVFKSQMVGIDIPTCVTEIGDFAFRGCNNLTSVTIPDSVISIGKGAFDCCNNLAIMYSGTMAQWNRIKKGEGWINKKLNYVILCSDGLVTE